MCRWYKIGPVFVWAYVVIGAVVTQSGIASVCSVRLVDCGACM